MSINLGDISILNINDAAYYCIFTGTSKREVVNLLQKPDAKKKKKKKKKKRKKEKKVEHYET